MKKFAACSLAVLLWSAPAAAPIAQEVQPGTDAAQAFALLLADHEEARRSLRRASAIASGEAALPERSEQDRTARLDQRRRIVEEEIARLAMIDSAMLSAANRLSYDILSWILQDRRDALEPQIAEISRLLPFNQFYGPHLSFARDMQWYAEFPYTRLRDYQRVIRRMQGFSRWAERSITTMREGVERGITLPRVIVERLIPQIEILAEPDPGKSIFMGPLNAMPHSISGAERERFEQAYRQTVSEVLIPACRNLLVFLREEYLPAARQSIGMSAMPGGRDTYLHLVRSQTTQALLPDAIHAQGLAEVARIMSEMERVKNEAGFAGSLEEFRAFLRTDAQFKFADADAMREMFKDVHERILTRADALFLRLPDAALEFRFIEPYAGASKAAAEYSPPSRNGRRPGIIHLNAHDLPARPAYTVEVLMLHEGIPGHHLQIGLLVENPDLPDFRRRTRPNAFVEGWALYAESLGAELGLYNDPYTKFGELSFDALRASRLVIDTGIHWLGWPRERAIAYLLTHTALTRTDAIAEVERYIALPAQALAYKIGQWEILRLRIQAENALGGDFDIRRFHDALLRDGAMPLPILRANMERWIAQESDR